MVPKTVLSDPGTAKSVSAPKQKRKAEPAPPRLDPSAAFLMDSLVLRPSMNRCGGIVYLTVRRWRRPVKRYQIDSLKALKANPPSSFVHAICHDIMAAFDPMLGEGGAFGSVVPIPCSHSPPESCLSVLLASRIGYLLGLPAISALTIEPASGSSHPKQNLDRPPMLLARKIDRPAIVIDDVATSGHHMEEAVRLLRPGAGTVFAIAWIGGEAEGE